jgi:hypothetical protein
VDQVASRSYVQVLDVSERNTLLDEVSKCAAGHSEPVELLYGVALFTAATGTVGETDLT